MVDVELKSETWSENRSGEFDMMIQFKIGRVDQQIKYIIISAVLINVKD